MERKNTVAGAKYRDSYELKADILISGPALAGRPSRPWTRSPPSSLTNGWDSLTLGPTRR
jgi:hypothetical protein